MCTGLGVLDEPYSAKSKLRSSHIGPPGYIGWTRFQAVLAYLDWRACTAIPLSVVSWLYGSSKTPAIVQYCTDSAELEFLNNLLGLGTELSRNRVIVPVCQATSAEGIHSLESIPELHNRLKIRAQTSEKFLMHGIVPMSSLLLPLQCGYFYIF
jgi:hypothetical protein